MKRYLVATTMLVLSTPGFADPAADRALANDHSRRGVALYEMGRYEGALVEFEQAYVRYPTGSLLYNLAQTHRRLDHCPEALEQYRRLLERYPDSPHAPMVRELLPELEAACAVKDRPPEGVSDGSATAAPVASVPRVEAAEAEAAVDGEPPRRAVDGRMFAALSGGVVAGAGASVAPLGATFGTSWRIAPLPVELGVVASIGSYAWMDSSYHGTSTASAAAVTVGRAVALASLDVRGDVGVGVIRLTGLERGHPLVAPGRRIDGGLAIAPELSATIAVERALPHRLILIGGVRLAAARGDDTLDGTLTSLSALAGVGYRP